MSLYLRIKARLETTSTRSSLWWRRIWLVEKNGNFLVKPSLHDDRIIEGQSAHVNHVLFDHECSDGAEIVSLDTGFGGFAVEVFPRNDLAGEI